MDQLATTLDQLDQLGAERTAAADADPPAPQEEEASVVIAQPGEIPGTTADGDSYDSDSSADDFAARFPPPAAPPPPPPDESWSRPRRRRPRRGPHRWS